MHLVVRTLATLAVVLTLAGCAVTYSPAPAPAPPRPAPPPPGPPPHARGPRIDVQFFYDALDPYGDWVWVGPYGWVWAPGAVDPFWRPYTVGRWVWTDYGWTWVSAERWGWAAYHYGRWARVPRHGWVWVPGTVWAPAWVAWRNGPGVVGWAPLPPEARYRAAVGIDWGSVDIDVVIRQDHWCFVDEVRVFEPHVGRHAYPVGRNVTVLPKTKRAVRIDVEDDRIVNRGFDDREFEQRLGRPVPRYRVVDDDAVRGREPAIRRDEVHMWRPQASEAPESARPRRAFGRPEGPPARERAEAEDDPAPAAPAPPPVERRIERGWERDWQRLQEMQKKDERPARTSTQRGIPSPSPSPSPTPAPRPTLERQREENFRAAENAYREQQAERARARREAQQPRPTPPRQGRGAGSEKKQDQDKDKEKEKEE